MSSTSYQRGRAAEYAIQHELEALGYTTTRAAGSKGALDVIAWTDQHIRYIQAKTFITKPGSYAADIRKLTSMPVPPHAIRELWVKKFRAKGWFKKLIITEETPCPSAPPPDPAT